MSGKKIAPYGAWISPVTPDLVAGKSVGLSGLRADGDTLYWQESRPLEGGRSALMQLASGAGPVEATPVTADVGSRVHEYGGGAYAVRDGRLVYSDKKEGGVWLIETTGTPPRRIGGAPGCRYADFEWSPNGRRVLAVREDHRGRPPSDPQAAIVAFDVAGSGESSADSSGEVLVVGPDFLSSPRLSPDGCQLAWISWDHPDMPWDATRLTVTVLEDGRPGASRVIGGDREEALVQPCWGADGRLYVASDRAEWWNVYRVEGETLIPVAPVEAEIGGPHWVFGQRYFEPLADGSILAALVRNGVREAVRLVGDEIRPLDLGPVQECPVALPAGGLAWIAVPPDEPPSLRRDGVALRRAAPAVLDRAAISIGQPITFPSTSRREAHAFWYAPASPDHTAPEGDRPPLIVIGHGGPTSMNSNGFSAAIQWWTSRGFGVVDVNYGGSTGFGRGYRRRLDGQWGVVDVEDCIAAAQYLAGRGLVDPSRVAIRGGSAGGYTVLAALTASPLFRAGASLYGIGDLKLLAGDTHKFELRYLDRLVGPLPEAEAIYEDRSPITHVDRITAGVIFFQGLDDKVVPPNQAATMAAAMRARGLPVAHYEFEGEGHGFRRAETVRRVLDLELDFYGRLFGFEPPGVTERVHLIGE